MSSMNRFIKDCEYTEFVNTTLAGVVEELRPNHVPLGPDFGFFDHQMSTEALQLHRLVKKFEVPADVDTDLRADASVHSVLTDDQRGLTSFNPGADPRLKGDVRHTLYNARVKLHEALANYSFSVSRLELTSGETYVSSRGDTSVYAKLRDAKQWCVTTHCKQRAYQLIYNSPMLRSAAKALYRQWWDRVAAHALKKYFASSVPTSQQVTSSRGKMWNEYHDEKWNTFVDKENKCHGPKSMRFKFFCTKLDKFVRVVTGARLTTVPKDNVVDRVILCEPWLNMLVERTIAGGIKECIKKHFHIDLKRSQDLHGLMISDLSNATIDWKNASNSNYWAAVSWLLKGTKLWKDIDSGRNRLVSYKDKWSRLNMVSPNGNGFTFELMTLILLSVGRVLDSFCHVYGDDVIIDRDCAPLYISTVEYLGYTLNQSKTFVHGAFRESCGAFFNEDYIVSYDLHYAEDIVDAVIVTNKIGIMAHATDTPLSNLWLSVHRKLVEHCPRLLLRAFRSWDQLKDPKSIGIHMPDLADGVIVRPSYLTKLRKANSQWNDEHKTFIIDHMDLLCDLGYASHRCHRYRYVRKRSLSYGDDDISWQQPDNVSRLRGWFFTWSGRCIAPTIRETELVTEFRIAIT